MKFEVKKDLWIILLMYLPILLSLLLVVMIRDVEIIFAVLILLPIDMVILWILYGSYYELRQTELYLKLGPFRQRIPYDKIKSVEPTKTILSSMALSVDRIEITRNDKGKLLGITQISPLEKERFMLELKKLCPNLKK
jgi:hypothetical protein